MDNILESAKDKLNELTQQTVNLFTKDVLDGVKEYGIEKLKEIWSQIESSGDIIQKTGYSITGIDMNLGIPPTFIISFDQIENINDEEEQKLLEEYKDKTIIYSILVALFKANAMQKNIQSANYKFSGLNIELGISPKLDMKFKKI